MKRKRIVSLLTALMLVLSAMLGCMTTVTYAAGSDEIVTSEIDVTEDTVGPALQDYTIEIANTDPKTEAGQEFKVTLIFDENLTTDRWTQSAFYIYLNDTLIKDTKYKLSSVTAEDNKLILDIVGNNDDFVALYQGRLKIVLRSNYYDDIMDEEGNGCSSWIDIDTYVQTGLAFEQDTSKTVAGDDSTSASVTFDLTGEALLRGMSSVQIMIGDEEIIVPVHTHNFIDGTNETWAANLANQFNNNYSGNYTMTADGASVTLTATVNGADEALAGATIAPYGFAAADEEAGIPNDAVVQPSLLNKAIEEAEARLAEMSSTQVTPSAKADLEAALAAAKAVAARDVTSIKTPLEWASARAQLEAAIEAAQNNSITTESAIRSTGYVTLNLLGGEEWVDSITGVQVGDTVLTADQFTVSADAKTVTIASLAFDKEGEITPRLKNYDITLTSSEYDAVTQTVQIEYRGADTFQVRYIDESGSVLASNTYTEAEMKAMSGTESEHYVASCTPMGPDIFLAKGVYIQDLLDKLLEGTDIDFDGNKTVVKIRTNDSLKYDADTDPAEVVNDSTTQDGYFNTISYNDLMRDRYYFPGLFDGSGAGDAYLASGRYSTAEREAMAADPNKYTTRPMIAWEYVERTYKSNPVEPTDEDYDDNLTADKAFRFLMGEALKTSSNGVDMVDDNYWTRFMAAYQCFGIDFVCETATVTFNTTPSDADITLTDISGAEMERNADGTFSVPQTPSQPYTYTVSRDGYSDVTGTFTVNAKAVASGITIDAELEAAADEVGPALQDYTIEIANTDPKTEAGSEFKVTLIFDETLMTDRWTQSAFYIYLNDTLIKDTKYKLNSVTAEDNKLILDIVGNNDDFVALYQGKLKIVLRSNYYEDIMDTEGNPCSYWTDIVTYVQTGLAFEQVDSMTVLGDENTPASVTFKLTGDAVLRGMSQVQLKVDGEDIADASAVGCYDSTVPVHTHNFISGTNEDWAANLANQFNNYTTGKYTMTSDGDTITLTATSNGPDEALANSTVIVPYAFAAANEEAGTPNDAVVQPGLLAQAIEKAEARLAEIKDYKVTASMKAALEEALAEAKEVAEKNASEIMSPTVWNEARNKLEAAIEASADNAIVTDSARRSGGSVSITLQGGQEWVDAITAVKIDGTTLSGDQYTIDASKKTITFQSTVFDKDGEITPRLNDYNISIMSAGYATVSKPVQIEYRGADTFQVRYLDSEGNVLASNTYTEEEMIAMSTTESQRYMSSCTVMGPDIFLAKGVYIQDLLDKLLAAAGDSVTFDPNTTVIKIRTNDSLKYAADADPADVVNDSTTQEGYFNTISYNDLMRDRYYFPGLFNGSGIGDTYLASGRFATAEREAVATDPDKYTTQPMIAWEYVERAYKSNQIEPTEDDYDDNVTADMGFRFLLGSPLKTSANGADMVDDNYWTQFLVAFQCFGIDFVCEGATVTFNTTPKSADVEVTDISGAVLTPNEDGTFTAPQTPSQPYTYTVTRNGYIEKTGTFTVNAKAVTGGITIDVDLEKDPDATITSDVIVNQTDGGTIAADKDSGVAGGETVTLAVTPAEGYQVDSVTVTDEDGNAVAVTEADGKCTFTMPEAEVTVEAAFSAIPEPEKNAVTIPADVEGGTVTAEPAEAAEGDTITLTLAPAEGYTADGVTVRDANGNEVAVKDLGGGKYSFEMPAKAVTVEPTFTAKPDEPVNPDDPCPSKQFSDLDTSKWYHAAVDFALNNGLMQGTSPTTFEPNTNVSRAMIVQILYNKEGKPAVSGASPFTDVADSAWYADAVKWASANDIVNGMGDGLFAPTNDVTREQAATILKRYAEFKGVSGTSGSLDGFADKDAVSNYAKEAMSWAVGSKIINGVSATELQPKGTATRAQMAQMFLNFENLTK